MCKVQGRGLSQTFIRKLGQEHLKPILDLVRRDHTLCLQIRENYINIYYRGGNILKISESTDGRYEAFFDTKYFKPSTSAPCLPEQLDDPSAVQEWQDNIPILKHGMDLWFGRYPKEEREAQQLLVRENGGRAGARKSGAKSDYLVCDIEYTNKNCRDARFDVICVHWPSVGGKRRKANDRRLVLLELKYGDNALRGKKNAQPSTGAGGVKEFPVEKSGLYAHLRDIGKFLSEPENLQRLKREMVEVFNQKRRLGLIECKKDMVSFSNERPLYVFLLANHDPNSPILYQELERLRSLAKELESMVDVAIATSSFLGYQLHYQGVHSLDDILSHYSKQVYSKTEEG